MSTSKQTFTQVKDILRKLDRSIDDAREKRLRPGLTPTGAAHERQHTNGHAAPLSGANPFRHA